MHDNVPIFNLNRFIIYEFSILHIYMDHLLFLYGLPYGCSLLFIFIYLVVYIIDF